MDLRERPTTVTARHPWETVRAGFFCRLLRDPLRVGHPVAVLDVGAGDGFVAGQLLAALPTGSSVICVDAEYTDPQLAALGARAPAGLRFSRPVPDGEFDAVVVLDVLEHVADDRGFLAGLARRLRPRGLVLISVPAHQLLFTQHDVALGHHRRYSAGELREVIARAGLAVRRAGSLFGSLVVPRALAKAAERARGIRSTPAGALASGPITTGVSVWPHGPLVTGAVRTALELDARLCELAARARAPSAGLSVWALCERAEGER